MPHPAATQPGARRRRAAPAERAWRLRTVFVAGGLFVGAGLLTAFVLAAALLRPPRPIGMAAVGAHYATNLTVPHNAHGWAGLEALCRLGDSGTPLRYGSQPLVRSPQRPLEVDEHFRWRDALRRLNGPTCVLVVSLHGSADPGAPYLLRSDCSPDDPPSNRLRVTKLIEALGERPPEQRKLVIFDCTAAHAGRHYGVLENRFAEGLRALDDAISAVPNLVVLTASDQGELSWLDRASGRTLFGDALVEGLRGAAHDADQDGRLTAAEVAAHVEARVAGRAVAATRRSQSTLLLPLGDEGRRRARAIDLALANSAYASAPTAPPPVPLDAISARWERAARLADHLPAPECTTPVSWRRYRRLLIRWEQLVAAGGADEAAQVAERLDDLEATLRREADLRRGMADPVQLSRTGARDTANALVDKMLPVLWAAAPKDLEMTWDSARQNVEPHRLDATRRVLYDRLLDRAEEDPRNNLRRAAAVARAIDDPGRAHPSEAHLLAMLAEGLPSDLSHPSWDTALELALGVRRLSESVLSGDGALDELHTPTIQPWLCEAYEAADARRRKGEDLLFGGVACLPQAVESLRAAQQAYQALDEQARGVRNALAVRDEAFDLLPFYTECVLAMTSTQASETREINELTGALERAWRSAHELGDALLASRPRAAGAGADVGNIAALAAAVDESLTTARESLREWRANLTHRTGAAFWNNRDAALLAPDLEIGDRVRLLAVTPPSSEAPTARKWSARLAEMHGHNEGPVEAVRRARLALASLGERLLESATQDADAYARQVRDLSGGEGQGVSGAIVRLERTLARAHRTLIASLQDQHQYGATPPAWSDQRVAEAAAIVRRVSIGGASIAGEAAIDQLRVRRRHTYYLWRAGRALADGWGSGDPDAEPYCRTAALAYLDCARRALPGRSATAELVAQAKAPFELHLDVPQRIDIVSRVTPPVSFRLDGAPVSGDAAVTVQAGAGLRLIAPQSGQRLIHAVGGPSRQRHQNLVVAVDDSAEPATHAPTLTLSAWFRGRRATASAPVTVHRTPDIQVDEPPRPRGAGVAILAPRPLAAGRGDGGVAFVLDASGSMGPVGGARSSKYAEAVGALRALLADTPAGVRVSVWVFGQAVGARKTVDEAEATIECVLRPTTWDPGDRPLAERLQRRLSYPRVEPWNESPLARAVLAASADLRGVQGYKSVVAITDGVDNRFAKDRVANPRGLPIGEVLKRDLAALGIAVHVVGFRVDDREAAQAKEQFAFLTGLTPPGKWWDAEQREGLETALRSALRQPPRVRMQPEDGWAGAGPSEAVVSPAGTPPEWPAAPLEPGVYALGTQASGARARVLLGGGDLMLLSLRDSSPGGGLVPAPFAATLLPQKPSQTVGQWRTTLLNHRRLPDGSTSSLVALERPNLHVQRSNALLQQARPVDVWMEAPCDGEGRGKFVCRRVDGYPAPCWELLQPASQENSRPPATSLNVWWSWPDAPTPARVLRRGADFDTPSDLVGRTWDVEGRPVEVLRVAVESRALPDSAGAEVMQSCLVVELATPALCKVRVEGAGAQGRRHQFFADAGRYVGLFWPVSPESARRVITRIDLVSIAHMKRHAEEHGHVARFTEMVPASPGDARPTPSVDWFDAAAP